MKKNKDDIFNTIANETSCPRCGSTDVSGNRMSASIGKAAIDIQASGPLAGIRGDVSKLSNKLYCYDCGNQWNRQ